MASPLVLSQLPQMAGCAVSSAQTWIANFQTGGMEALMARKPAPGKTSPLQAPDVQAQLQAGLKAGQWCTAGQVREWLFFKNHQIKRAERSIYYWLEKLSRVLRVSRPVHIYPTGSGDRRRVPRPVRPKAR